MNDGFSHIDDRGESRMVDVSGKEVTERRARAEARVSMLRSTRDAIVREENPKGSVLGVARIAGIQATKRTSELIPLCHGLSLDHAQVEFRWEESEGRALLCIECQAAVSAKTGVEMEALTGASVAALTVYDMCKAVDRGMVISSIRLIEKTGGRSGHWKADHPPK